MKIMKFVTMCMIAAILSGCACFNTVNATSNRTTTIGQELMDLQKAKEAGVLTEDEYNKCKEQLVNQAQNSCSLNFKAEKSCK